MKMFRPRPKKDLRWEVNDAELEYNSGTVGIATLCSGNQLVGGLGKAHVNIKRMIFEATVCVQNNELEEAALQAVWGRSAWMLLLVDEDDTTVYDPVVSSVRRDEVVLREGLTERIGWGTVTELVTNLLRSQSAAFMAQCKIEFDVKCNRRLTTDQLLQFYITRTGSPDMDVAATTNFSVDMRLRTLYQVP